jgi:hypothetical protein
LRSVENVTVLQLGWLHVNRAMAGKKSEYPQGRASGEVEAEIGAGRARLQALFGSQAAPIFVPPWNRIAPNLVPVLTKAGIAALSAMSSNKENSANKAGAALAGPQIRNVHVDVTAWKEGRGFVGTELALSMLVGRLHHLRSSVPVPPEPIGVLTHHLVMDRATREFMRRLLAVTAAHRAVRWLSPTELIA